MSRKTVLFGLCALLLAALLAGCATLSGHDPLNVTVAGIEPLQGEGMELRLLVKLRVQNPNDAPLDYDGVSLNLDVQGRSFASGVSAEAGTVPRFGEAIVTVPVTVSLLRMVRQVMGMLDGQPVDQITYDMSGKLSGASMFGTQRFSAKGDFQLPRKAPAPEVVATPDT
jgi:LEA14-like dessication related protein